MTMAEAAAANRKRKASEVDACPYLDTIQRSLLDFDFEPACSVSLEKGPHTYGCLVCGKYFRGRGPRTPAYTHSVEESHFVFVHLANGTFHCLPDDYEIKDPSLNDIAAALHPTFTEKEITTIDQNTDLSRDLFGRRYLSGFVGLNNLHKTDCINAIVQALAHVRPIRDYFLRQTHHKESLVSAKSKAANSRQALEVTQCFGELVRKMWSDKRFKSTVDPHMLVQAISVASKKKFRVGLQAEAGELMAWLLNHLHVGVGGGKKPGSSIIHKTFQGKVQVTTRQAKKKEERVDLEKEDDRIGSGDEEENEDVEMKDKEDVEIEEKTTDTHFLQLTLDIPEKPLFRDDEGGLVIPQEPLVNVLKKFDGVTFSDALSRSGTAQRKRYRLLELPDYLILHLARFKTNQYSKEKNPTIVAFPVKNFDLSKYVHPEGGREKPPTPEEVQKMSIKELKALLTKYGQKDIAEGAVEKKELIDATLDFVTKSLPDLLMDKYDLVANITHESPADVGREGKHDPLQDGSYKCHVQHRATKQWYEIQDLHVQEESSIKIGLSESYLLIFRKTGLD